MVRSKSPVLLFRALGDDHRLRIFELLLQSPMPLTLGDVAEKFDISRQAISRHIARLQAAGLIDLVTRGRERYCHPNPRPLLDAAAWIGRCTAGKFADNQQF
jgi:DNA-binding transcriptional ArsR family regulator